MAAEEVTTEQPAYVHQFARGIHALCGLEIVAGVNGTRRTADITCPECLEVRNRIEIGYAIFKLHPVPGDVIVIDVGPRQFVTQDVVEQTMMMTEKLRADYPEVSFFLMPSEDHVKHLSEVDMNAMGWHRGKKVAVKAQHFSFNRGQLVKK